MAPRSSVCCSCDRGRGPHVQVLKDLFALDDGAPITKGSRRVSGRTLGSALCRQGLVPLLLSFLVALGPIRTARPAPSGVAQPNSALAPSMEPSITATAASLPRLPPYLGFRTDIVAGVRHGHVDNIAVGLTRHLSHTCVCSVAGMY